MLSLEMHVLQDFMFFLTEIPRQPESDLLTYKYKIHISKITLQFIKLTKKKTFNVTTPLGVESKITNSRGGKQFERVTSSLNGLYTFKACG